MTVEEALNHAENTDFHGQIRGDGVVFIHPDTKEALKVLALEAKRYQKVKKYLQVWSIMPSRWWIGMRDQMVRCLSKPEIDTVVDALP